MFEWSRPSDEKQNKSPTASSRYLFVSERYSTSVVMMTDDTRAAETCVRNLTETVWIEATDETKPPVIYSNG